MFEIETYDSSSKETYDVAEADSPEAALLAVETLLNDSKTWYGDNRRPVFIRARVRNLDSGKIVWDGNTVATQVA